MVMEKRDLFWELLEPEHPKAWAFCRRLSGERDEANDLYHDSLVKAASHFESLRDRNAFRPWLYRIIVNTFKSRRRSPKILEFRGIDAFSADLPEFNDPSEHLRARRLLQRGFEVLKPAERALITLYELEGWNIAELSEIFGKPEGTIKSKLARIRTKMRKEIEKRIFDKRAQIIETEAGYALPRSKR